GVRQQVELAYGGCFGDGLGGAAGKARIHLLELGLAELPDVGEVGVVQGERIDELGVLRELTHGVGEIDELALRRGVALARQVEAQKAAGKLGALAAAAAQDVEVE